MVRSIKRADARVLEAHVLDDRREPGERERVRARGGGHPTGRKVRQQLVQSRIVQSAPEAVQLRQLDQRRGVAEQRVQPRAQLVNRTIQRWLAEMPGQLIELGAQLREAPDQAVEVIGHRWRLLVGGRGPPVALLIACLRQGAQQFGSLHADAWAHQALDVLPRAPVRARRQPRAEPLPRSLSQRREQRQQLVQRRLVDLRREYVEVAPHVL